MTTITSTSSTTPSRSSNSSNKKSSSSSSSRTIQLMLVSFLIGCIISSLVVINIRFSLLHDQTILTDDRLPSGISTAASNQIQQQIQQTNDNNNINDNNDNNKSNSKSSILDGVKILIGIASFDFSQIPHLEEVLDGYFDLCASGSYVEVVIHTTVPYPVTLIDMYNTRFKCTNPSPSSGFKIRIVVLPTFVRLHLVDYHRQIFYDNIDNFDLFIYSEDDVRVSPKTIMAYISETQRVQNIVGIKESYNYNVGIARYEYNFPPDIIINDKTRHVTQNVTRVYWEHSWKPPIPKSIDQVPQTPLKDYYVHMINHHQGMYIATRDLLKAWRQKNGCNFDVVKNRPGMKNNPSQPSEGTQRVWMSSQQLYGKKHCNIQQLIPIDKFGELTVLHLPNKNYRRVGKHGRLGGANAAKKEGLNGEDINNIKEENIDMPSSLLLTAMELHIMMTKQFGSATKGEQKIYNGAITMIDQVTRGKNKLLSRRMKEYNAYVQRGGILSDYDMTRTLLYEDE